MSVFIPSFFMLFQVGGAAEKLLDELFNSTPTRIIFVLMVLAVGSMPLMFFFFLRITNRQMAAFQKSTDRLLGLIDKQQTYLNEVKDDNSENYLMIKTYLEQWQALIGSVSASIASNQGTANSALNAIGDLLIQATTLHAQTRVDIQTSFKKELQAAIESILDQHRIDVFQEFQPPADDDCRYQIKLVRAALTPAELVEGDSQRDILLHKVPIFKDGNEAGRLRGSGEVVQVITEMVFPGWVYIKQMYGEPRIAGYARLAAVNISDLPDTMTVNVNEK